MNFKLVLSLSLFGLAMGIATVCFVPSNIEQSCGSSSSVISAWAIAAPLQGPFFTGLRPAANSVWVTGAHVLLYDSYVASHTEELHDERRAVASHIMMLLVARDWQVSGVVLGLFALVAGKLVAGSRYRRPSRFARFWRCSSRLQGVNRIDEVTGAGYKHAACEGATAGGAPMFILNGAIPGVTVK
jgi:hypothetical protein